MKSEEIFTGERFVPGIHDRKLEIEHYQRYLSVRKLAEGKCVLDAACGEGYGSNILAETAREVIAVDIDKDAVSRARKLYEGKGNLSFRVGSIEKLDLPDHSIDVVVSFETIEHVYEEIQNKFLAEIDRVLKTNGILIISTPNKAVYSDMHNYKNEFHMKEFYHDEFVSFLRKKFQYVQLYNQAFRVLSVIDSCDRSDEIIDYYSREQKYNDEGKYYIAIASHEKLNKLPFASLYVDNLNEYDENISRILTLQKEEESRNAHIKHLNAELENQKTIINNLQEDNEARNQHIKKLDSELEKRGNTIRRLQKENDDRNRHIDYLDSAIMQNKHKIEAYEAEIEAKDRQIESQKQQNDTQLQTILNQSEKIAQQTEDIEKYAQQGIEKSEQIEKQSAENAEQQKIIVQQDKDISDYKNRIAELEQTVKNKEGHIELLLEVERSYEREKNTHSYKMTKKMQKAGDFLLPPDSRRRFFTRIIVNIFKHPIVMFHVINPTRIKNYIKYMKNGDMQGVKRGFETAVRTEKMGLSGNAVSEVSIMPVQGSNTQELKTESFEKITFQTFPKPEVSIIIPVYNEFHYTYNCLKSILKNSGDVAYEVIIANDCSIDLTKNITDIVSGIKVVTTKKNMRFLLNCNNAAKHAKGKYILFLNNDTQVQENWLHPLVQLIESDDRTGMVGSKLVYPDGYLQEAGGILWRDGSAWNYGNRKNPEDPEYNYVKEADYISGAAIMIKKSLWNEIGGFDERFVPAYYEDTDLAFEVRKHGYKVRYQPLSVVVHFEGVSNGTDLQGGQKQYQQVNYQKFFEKWKDILENEHEENGKNVFIAKDRSIHKKHILVVDHYVPHHDQDAGGKCTYMYLKLFVKMGFQVTFIGDNFYKHEPYTTELNQMGIEVLYGNFYYNNWQEWLKENSHYFDYIYLQRPHIAIKYIDLVRQYSRAKILYFAHDLHHIRERREYEMTNDPEKLKSSENWKKTEYELFEKADVGHVVGTYEQTIMQQAFPNKPIRNIPLYIYDEILMDINKNFSERQDLLYVGGFGHPPNIDAVLWFAKEVFPIIVNRFPDIKWHIVGGKATKEIEKLASDNIIIEGFVTDEYLEKLYRTCRIAIVPLRFGAGVKGKVVEAGYYQIPLVTTSIGAEGLNIEDGAMLIEDNGTKMAELVCSLYQDFDRLREMSERGKDFIRKNFLISEAERVIKLDISEI